jgi:hypothetical protein
LDAVGALTYRELERWQRYWIEEPWGPLRDNMHAAMIVSELLKPHYREGATPLPMTHFLFELDEDRSARAAAQFVAQLEAMAAADERRARERRPPSPT